MNSSPSKLLSASALSLALGTAALPATEPATDARLRALEHEVSLLRRELAAERARNDAGQANSPTAVGEEVTPPAMTEDPIELEDVFVRPKQSAVTELKVRGRMHYQFGYSQADDYSDFHTWEWRRMRLGVDGKLLDGWRFHLMANILPDSESTDLDSAYIRYDGLDWASLSLEKLRPRFGRELNTSSSKIKTVERSLLSNTFDPGKITGTSLAGDHGIFDWQIGVYNGEFGDQRSSELTGNDNQGVPEYLINASVGLDLSEKVGLDALAFRLDYIDNNDDDGINQRFAAAEDAWAASVALGTGPLDVVAEYVGADLHRGGEVSGFYLMPSLMLGEKWEAVARYEWIEAEDGASLRHQSRYARRVVASDPGVSSASSVRGEDYWALYGGLNYYFNTSFKLMFGVEYAEIDDAIGGGRGLRTFTGFGAARLEF